MCVCVCVCVNWELVSKHVMRIHLHKWARICEVVVKLLHVHNLCLCVCVCVWWELVSVHVMRIHVHNARVHACACCAYSCARI